MADYLEVDSICKAMPLKDVNGPLAYIDTAIVNNRVIIDTEGDLQKEGSLFISAEDFLLNMDEIVEKGLNRKWKENQVGSILQKLSQPGFAYILSISIRHRFLKECDPIAVNLVCTCPQIPGAYMRGQFGLPLLQAVVKRS